MKFKIPKSFKLLGFDWKVKYDNKKLNDKENYGESHFFSNSIILSTTQGLESLSKDKINQTFFHELVHAILDTMKEHDLSENEKFVDLFGNLLYQFIKTME